jgi:hypothetical protein
MLIGFCLAAATISKAQLTSERQIFENKTIIWQNVLEKKPKVPKLSVK